MADDLSRKAVAIIWVGGCFPAASLACIRPTCQPRFTALPFPSSQLRTAICHSRFTANFQSWNSSAASSSSSLAVRPKTTQGLRHGAQLIPLSQQKMSREIRRASDNASGNAFRPETLVKGYGEWPKLMFKHRAKGGIEVRNDPCFFAAPPDKIVFVATFAISEKIDMDKVVIGYCIDEPRRDPEIIASTERACAQPHFDMPPKSAMSRGQLNRAGTAIKIEIVIEGFFRPMWKHCEECFAAMRAIKRNATWVDSLGFDHEGHSMGAAASRRSTAGC